jgi:DNA-binding response OmpR family regulator
MTRSRHAGHRLIGEEASDMPQLLVVEDDVAVGESLQLALKDLGHTVHRVCTGEDGLEFVRRSRSSVDAAIVDVMLPGIDGFEVCRRLSAAEALPIVLLTARSDSVDVVVGLECGADDYVVKPVEPRVLDARIKAVLRRVSTPITTPSPVTVIGALTVDEGAMLVTRAGVDMALTPTELRLLIELLHHSGQALTRRSLLERVWDYGYVGDSRLVDACIQRLRAKIEDDPANPSIIRTVRGVGYRLVLP